LPIQVKLPPYSICFRTGAATLEHWVARLSQLQLFYVLFKIS